MTDPMFFAQHPEHNALPILSWACSDAALAYAARGWAVFPAPPGEEEILQIGQDEKHRALELWAQHVDMVTTGKAAPGKVVQLRT